VSPSSPSYRCDTWGPLKSAATWYFRASRVQAWPEDAIRRLYRTLGEDARVRAVHIESGDFRPGDVLHLAPAGGTVPVDAALAHAAAFRGAIGTLAFDLEIRAYVCAIAGGAPALAWVGEGTEATLMPDAPPLEADARLNLWHSLFRPRSPQGADNEALYRLNAPILAGLLRRFAEEFGLLVEYEGAGVTEAGFRPYSPEVYG
jgi:hypothetical protein